MFDPSAVFYMEKLAVGPDCADVVDINAGVRENLLRIAAVITLVTAKETAIAGIFLWIATLPWNLWSLERSSKRSFRASSIIQFFRAF